MGNSISDVPERAGACNVDGTPRVGSPFTGYHRALEAPIGFPRLWVLLIYLISGHSAQYFLIRFPHRANSILHCRPGRSHRFQGFEARGLVV